MGRNVTPTVWGRSTAAVVGAEIAFLIGAVVVGAVTASWWIGAVVGLVLVIPFVSRIHGQTLGAVLRTRLSFMASQRGMRTPAPLPPAFDVTGPDGERIGLRWDGDVITSLIRLLPVREEITSMRHGTAYTRDTVPLRALAESLSQFDITLDGIDVVSLGARTGGESLQAAVYERLLGPLPAIARRNTWLTVRFRPHACPEAVARRGGDTQGAIRAAAIATTRIVRRLAECGHAAKVLPAADVNAVVSQLTGGVPLDNFEQDWETARSVRELHTSFTADRAALAGDNLAPLWGPTARNTALTLQLRPGPGETTSVGAVVRYLTPQPLDVPQSLPASPLRGRQFEALLASLPFGGRGQAPIAETAQLDGDALDQMSIPASGCGQLIGADASGNAIAVRIAAADVRRVEIVGGLYLAQQVVLRAIAVGARVLVHTDRPHAWQPMVEAVGAGQVLRIATSAAASSQANSEREFTTVLLDGAETTALRADLTIIRLLSDERPTPPSQRPEIRLVQRYAHDDSFLLQIAGEELALTMVTIPDELRIIGASQPGRRPMVPTA